MRIVLICSVFLSLLYHKGIAQATTDGPHGGTLKNQGYYRVELVECYEYLELYAFGMDMVPIRNYGLSGYVDFYFPDNSCATSVLYSYGIDGFTASISQQRYSRCQVNIHGVGIIIKIDFEGFSDNDMDVMK